mmetsp:Transcript_32260/g.74269  ORF Transcript_32260/g.74269 Transcript_32260/m.74269 type:complete len:310 (-) Transcript_32260:420-1349(-)
MCTGKKFEIAAMAASATSGMSSSLATTMPAQADGEMAEKSGPLASEAPSVMRLMGTAASPNFARPEWTHSSGAGRSALSLISRLRVKGISPKQRPSSVARTGGTSSLSFTNAKKPRSADLRRLPLLTSTVGAAPGAASSGRGAAPLAYGMSITRSPTPGGSAGGGEVSDCSEEELLESQVLLSGEPATSLPAVPLTEPLVSFGTRSLSGTLASSSAPCSADSAEARLLRELSSPLSPEQSLPFPLSAAPRCAWEAGGVNLRQLPRRSTEGVSACERACVSRLRGGMRSPPSVTKEGRARACLRRSTPSS